MGAIAGAVAGPIIGGVIGNITSQGQRDAANKAYQDALDTIQSVGAPPDLSQAIILDKFKSAGVLTPELEKAVNLGASKVSQIQEDPRLRQAQMSALQSIQQRGAGGLSPSDRAAYAQMQQQAAQDAEAKRQQILQNFAARGQGGAGAELIAELNAGQNAANQQNMAGLQLAGQASQNALQAMAQAGQLGGQIRGQEFDINKAKANAEDVFNQFNVQNQIARQQRNVGAQNQAQAANLQNAQNLSNANVQSQNAELNRQNQAKEQYWQDKLAQARGVAGAEQQRGSQFQNEAQQNANMWSGMGNAVGGAFGSLAASQAKEKKPNSTNFNKGGMVPCYDEGGEVPEVSSEAKRKQVQDSYNQSMNESILDKIKRAANYNDGGIVPHYFKDGGQIPGVPLFHGDNPLNDIRDIKASPGEIVLPNSVTQSEHAPENAKHFVSGVLSVTKHRRMR